MQYKSFSFSLIFLAAVALLLAGCVSLAADVTPPPDYRPAASALNPAEPTMNQPVDRPAAASTAFPILPPNPAAGKAIYDEKCEPCHGPTGLGDGSKAGNLPQRPPMIGAREVALTARPAVWYSVVTQGNIEKFMPGFKAGLDDRQRWDVVAYVYTLSQTDQEIETGKALYDEQCAACHGTSGKGDGPQASGSSMPDWSRQDRLAVLSSQEIADLVASGTGGMPSFSNLSQEDRLALAAYVRRLTFTNSPVEIAEATQPAPEAELSGAGTPAAGSQSGGPLVIRGKLTAQDANTQVGGLKVTLLGYQGMNQSLQEETVSAEDGSYEFTVDHQSGMAYMVQVAVNDFKYNSDILHSQDVSQSPVDLPVTIYATTTDASLLSVDRMHVFFDFSIPQKVQVVELFIVSNNGQSVVVAGGPEKPALTFKLPEGATDLQFESGAIGDRYVAIPGGFGDLAAVGPGQGQHQVLFSYNLPYDRKLDLSIPLTMDVAAAVVMMPVGGVRLTSGQLIASGSRDVQGMTFELYTGSNLRAGNTLDVSLSGKAREAGAAETGTTSGLLVGLGAFGLVLIGAGLWIYRQRNGREVPSQDGQQEPLEQESVEGLLDAILALDDLHQAGKLPDDAYQKRRAELKARLKALKEN